MPNSDAQHSSRTDFLGDGTLVHLDNVIPDSLLFNEKFVHSAEKPVKL
jgi:hypothetical protein